MSAHESFARIIIVDPLAKLGIALSKFLGAFFTGVRHY